MFSPTRELRITSPGYRTQLITLTEDRRHPEKQPDFDTLIIALERF
jgi:hypothetical protein